MPSTASHATTQALLNALCRPDGRAEAAQALARHLGAQDLALYIKDPQLGVMLPAPGMPKTVAAGPLWREFLTRCEGVGSVEGEVDWPAGSPRQAVALVVDGVAAILAGGQPQGARLAQLEAQLPLLAALLQAEQALHLGAAEAAEARYVAARAHTLAQSLDTARAAAAGLNLQLRQEHERKDEFLAMLAHELRNPLSPLVNSVEILRRRGMDAPCVHQLNVMQRQLDQLTGLVDDLLDVSRVSRGLIELDREPLSLAAVLADAVEACRPALESRQHSLQLTGMENELYVNADRIRLLQVFTNLLQNAAKYTDAGGKISVAVVPDMRRASVVVRDNGIGIPQDMLSRIFDLFAQGPVGLDRSQGGLGIGLTLVRTLLELHGGHVTAHSVGPGQGSTFTASLPLVDPPLKGPGRPQQETLSLTACKVLVVEDNRDAADSLAQMLRIMGAQVSVAHDGREALALAAQVSPQLVLMDIGLPGMDGYETARRLRALPGAQPRLVALTGYGTGNDKVRAREAGFDEHWVKPVAPDAIARMLVEAAEADAMQVTS